MNPRLSSSLTRLLHNQSAAQAAIFIGVVLFFSKFIGFARDVLIAGEFGATGQTDAFLVGMMVPNAVLGLLFADGLRTLIVPWYIGHKKADPARARTLVDQVVLVSAIVFAGVSLGVWALAPQLVQVFANGLDGARYDLAVQVMRLLAPTGFMLVMTALLTGLLQAEGSFLVATLWVMAGNIGLVAALVACSSHLGIHAWTLGQNVMGAVSFFPLVALVASNRYGFLKRFDVHHIEWVAMWQFARLVMPVVLAGGVATLNIVVDRWAAARLPEGAIASLNFAGRVWTLPLTLLATPIATATFPALSAMAADRSALQAMDDKVRRTLNVIAYVVIPSSVVVVVLATPITRLLFQRGAFDAHATGITASCIRMYGLGLVFQAAMPVLGRVFYAFKDTMTPLTVGAGMVGANMAGNIVLSRYWGAAGIALATTITVVIGATIFALLLRRRFRTIDYASPVRPFWAQMFRVLLANIPVALVACLGLAWIDSAAAFVPLLSRTLAVFSVVVVVYVTCSIALRLDGWQIMQGRFAGLVRRTRMSNRGRS